MEILLVVGVLVALVAGWYCYYKSVKSPLIVVTKKNVQNNAIAINVFADGVLVFKNVISTQVHGEVKTIKNNFFATFSLKIETLQNQQITLELLQKNKVLQKEIFYVPF